MSNIFEEFRELSKDFTEVPRRRVQVVIPKEETVKSPRDLTIVMRSLTSSDEINAGANANASPMALIMDQVKSSIETVNGVAPKASEGDLTILWEQILGQVGRNLLLRYYAQLANPSEEGAKKADASLKIL